MNDTTPEAEAHLNKVFAAKSPAERLRMGCSMFSFSRQLVTSAILRENPDITPNELRIELFRIFYREDFEPEQLERIVRHLRMRN